MTKINFFQKNLYDPPSHTTYKTIWKRNIRRKKFVLVHGFLVVWWRMLWHLIIHAPYIHACFRNSTMAGLEDVEAWLDASDKNGVSVFACSILSYHRFWPRSHFQQLLAVTGCSIFNYCHFPPQDGSLSYEEFKFAFVGTNMINLWVQSLLVRFPNSLGRETWLVLVRLCISVLKFEWTKAPEQSRAWSEPPWRTQRRAWGSGPVKDIEGSSRC